MKNQFVLTKRTQGTMGPFPLKLIMSEPKMVYPNSGLNLLRNVSNDSLRRFPSVVKGRFIPEFPNSIKNGFEDKHCNISLFGGRRGETKEENTTTIDYKMRGWAKKRRE